jgi:hypothetical protein
VALTAAQIQAHIDAIDAAIASGVRSVQFSDRSTTYRSVDEMLTARAHLVGLLGRANGAARQTLVVANKGFCS